MILNTLLNLTLTGAAWLACLLGISLLQGSEGGGLSGPAALWSRFDAHPALLASVQWLLRRRTRIGAGLASTCLLAAFMRPQQPWDPMALGPATCLALALMLSGTALRIAALGVIHKRAVLASTGVYSLCRHPLYVGTILIVFGACTLFRQPGFSSVALVYFLALYPLTIAKEEFQNVQRFGPAFDAYRESTPLVLPLGRWRPPETFGWRRALLKGGAGALACVVLAFTMAEVLLRWSTA